MDIAVPISNWYIRFLILSFFQSKDVVCQTKADINDEDGDGIVPAGKRKMDGELDFNVSAF